VTEEKADRETLDVAGTKTTETAKAEVKTTEQTAKAENKTTTEQTATAKTDSIKTDTTAKTTNTSADTSSDNGGKKQTATTKPVQAASTGTTESTETATTEATTEKKKIWHEPVYETVETKTPVYEYFPVTVQKDCCVCWDCGAILYTQDDLNNHFNADHPGNGYYSSTYTVETGEYTYDVAYYEYSTETVLVSEGYWEYID
jgi:flagellar hook protein FlgE